MKYCKITYDKKGKKLVDFGKKWGAMKKDKANASFIETGNGLYVIDIDSKNIPKKYKSFVKSLGVPTVETARGYHYYVDSKFPMTNHQNIFNEPKDGFKVDIRGEGGVVFTNYWGKDKKASYLKNDVPHLKDNKFKVTGYLPSHVVTKRDKKSPDIERGDIGKMSKDEVKDLVKDLDVMKYQDRDSWIRMLASIYHGGGDKVEKIARKWSKLDKDNYDEASFNQVWKQFSKGQYGEDISVGTLIDAVRQPSEPAEDAFKSEKGSVFPLSKKEKKKKVKKEAKEKRKKKKGYNPLDVGGRMTDKMAEEMKNQKHLIEGVVVSGFHTILFSRAGNMKTSVAAWMGVEILKENEDKIIHHWAFDSSANHNASIFKYAKTCSQSVQDRFMLYTGKTADDFQTHYEKAVEYESDLSRLVLIIDTYKFITKDVNNKGANKDALHFIKKLQALGATVLTLAHSNKVKLGENVADVAGTAELEQDSDALLTIEKEGTQEDGFTLTIKAFGRSRFSSSGTAFMTKPTGKDFDFLYTTLETMEKIEFKSNKDDDPFKSDGALKAEKEKLDQEKDKRELADRPYIKILRRTIDRLNKDNRKHVKPFKSTIRTEMLSNESLSKNKVDKLLRDYNGVHWKWKPTVGKGGSGDLYKTLKSKSK